MSEAAVSIPDSPPSQAAELADEFAELNSFLHAGGDPQKTIRRLILLAVRSIPGCNWAALTIWPVGKQPSSLACSDDVAWEVDRLQYEIGEGPCLDAAAESDVVPIADLASDDRWPRFAAAVVANTPVREVMAFPLTGLPQRHALNLYSGSANTFDEQSLSIGALFAAHAHTLLLHAESATDATNLRHALVSSRLIGTAVGILMTTRKITEDQAFQLLRGASQHLNRKLRDVAGDVTLTGDLPDAP